MTKMQLACNYGESAIGVSSLSVSDISLLVLISGLGCVLEEGVARGDSMPERPDICSLIGTADWTSSCETVLAGVVSSSTLVSTCEQKSTLPCKANYNIALE
jgi:hypothetical protein